MPKIKEEDSLKNLDFVCKRCSAECQKINAYEPEIGYLSKVDGAFVGPLCTSCLKEIPENEQAIRKLVETAFLVVIKPDGEGAFISTDGIEVPFRRDALPYDIISGCSQILNDMRDAQVTAKLIRNVATLNRAQQQHKGPIVIPR
jgi:hypothetical protein